MMKNLRIFLLISVVIVSFLSSVKAEVPKKIYYQGRLTDSSKNPLTGSYNFTFSIYDVASGGSALWTETHNGVTVEAGVFSVELGESTPLNLNFDKQYYLEIKVGSETFSPRRPLLTSPYSFRASIADAVTNNSITSSMIIDGTIKSNDLANNSIVSSKIKDNAITSSKLANNSVNNDKISAVGWSKVTNKPAGFADGVDDTLSGASAGGDLTGTYPNPTIGTGKINDDKISAVGWSKVTNKPVGFADGVDNTLSGSNAGGDLTGTYPNPTIGTGKVDSTKIADGTIVSSDIADNGITPTKISKGVITFATQYEGTAEVSTTTTGDPGYAVASVTFTLPTGNYLLYIMFTGEGHPSGTYSMYIRIGVDSETTPMRYERYNDDTYQVMSQNRLYGPISGGSHTVSAYMQSNNSAGTAYMRNRRLTVLAIKW